MLHSRLKEELDNMEKSDITDWFNALVVVEKPYTGKLGVCLDPRNLNKAIKRLHYSHRFACHPLSIFSVSIQFSTVYVQL